MSPQQRIQEIIRINTSNLPAKDKLLELQKFVDQEKKAETDAKLSTEAEKAKQIPQKVEIEGAELVTIKGEKGDKPTNEELISLIEPLIPEPKNGIDGKTPTEEELKRLIKLLIPKPIVGPQGPPGESIIGPMGPVGPAGVDGKSADSVEISAVVNEAVKQLKALKGEKRLHIKHLDGLDKFLADARDKIKAEVTYQSVGRVIGGGSYTAGTGIVISSDKVISSTITGGGGTGFTKETPAGTVDGSNAVFTVTHAPNYVVSDGITYFDGAGYILAGLTITLTVPPTSYIRSYY